MTNNQVGTLEKTVTLLSKILICISMGMLLIMMFVGIADVIGRYLFNKPIVGTFEVFEILLPGIVLFGLAYTQLMKGHIRVEVFYSRFPPRIKVILDFAITIWAIVLFALLVWRGAQVAIFHWHTGRLISNIRVPIYFVELFIPVGALAICLVLIVDLFHIIKIRRR